MQVTSTRIGPDLPKLAAAASAQRDRRGGKGGVLGAAIDPSFRLIAVTPAYAEVFASLFGALPQVGDDLQALMMFRVELGLWRPKLWARALAGEEVSTLLVADPPGQRRRFFETLFRPLRDDQGDVAAAVQVARDVTEELFERARLVESGLRSRDQRLPPRQRVRRPPSPNAGFTRPKSVNPDASVGSRSPS